MHTNIHTHIHTCIHTHTTCIYIHTCTLAYNHTHTYIHAHTNISTYMHSHPYTYAPFILLHAPPSPPSFPSFPRLLPHPRQRHADERTANGGDFCASRQGGDWQWQQLEAARYCRRNELCNGTEIKQSGHWFFVTSRAPVRSSRLYFFVAPFRCCGWWDMIIWWIRYIRWFFSFLLLLNKSLMKDYSFSSIKQVIDKGLLNFFFFKANHW